MSKKDKAKANKESPDSNISGENIDQITFIYSRSNYYREVHANGAFGGLTPNIDIHMSFYNQHKPHFQKQVFKLNDDGTLGEQIKVEPSPLGFIAREIEVGITMDISTAISLNRWLERQIIEAQRALGTDIAAEIVEES